MTNAMTGQSGSETKARNDMRAEPSDARRGMSRNSGVSLSTDHGNTRIAEGVVSKIAGLAAREIPGVYSMGNGMARRFGQIKSFVGAGGDTGSPSQGVSVEVGEKEAAVDLDLVTFYGQSISEVTSAVRDHVTRQVEDMTGLKVVEVNITVDDIYVEGQETKPQEEPRVQ